MRDASRRGKTTFLAHYLRAVNVTRPSTNMELPRPPAWYGDANLVPPRPPKNKQLRSFGSPDLDDSFWAAERPLTEHCATIKALNKDAVRCFCELLRLAARPDEEAEVEVEKKGEALQELFDAMHVEVGKLRIPEGRANIKQHLEEETRQRRATARRLRAAAADARRQIAAMLDGPDAPPYVNPEEQEDAICERAMRISDSTKAHEAAEHARLCLEGRPPADDWDLDPGPVPTLDDLGEFVEAIQGACAAAERQHAGRRAWAAARSA